MRPVRGLHSGVQHSAGQASAVPAEHHAGPAVVAQSCELGPAVAALGCRLANPNLVQGSPVSPYSRVRLTL